MSVPGNKNGNINELYLPLDASTNEIRLLSIESESRVSEKPMRLTLHHVSLDDWNLPYAAFRHQNTLPDNGYADFALWCHLTETKHSDRFTWGEYVCLSYDWGDGEDENTTILINGVEKNVTQRLALALQDVDYCFVNGRNIKVWVDSLCINQADVNERNDHVLRVKNIFGLARGVVAWIKNKDEMDDLEEGYYDLHPPGANIDDCAQFLQTHGRKAFEEILGVRTRNWGHSMDGYGKLLKHARGFTCFGLLTFDFDYGYGKVHLRDILQSELLTMLSKEYWSRPWIIQELAASPVETEVYWGNWGGPIYTLSDIQTMAEILLNYEASGRPLNTEVWEKLKPKLELLHFIATWKAVKSSTDATNRLNDATIRRQLNLITSRSDPTLPHDKVYSILGLFPPCVSDAVTIDYSGDAEGPLSEFCSLVPGWVLNEDM